MQYMLLICDDEKNLARMSDARRAELMKEYGQFIEDIVKSGEFRAGAQLQLTSSATTVRLKNGKRITTDGPFAETKEQIGGYFLVECKDLDAALAIAARVPSARAGGSIEVRPLVPTSVAARTPPAA